MKKNFVKYTYLLIVFVLPVFIITSCLPEQRMAETFVKKTPEIRLLVVPPEYIYKYNHKGELVEDFERMTDRQQDSALLYSSRYVQRISDSILLENYINQFVGELRKANFDVFLPAEVDSFLVDRTQAYTVNISQIQLDEYLYPLEDKESFNDTLYYKKFDLNAMDFSVWVELSKVTSEKPKKTVLYDSQSAFDNFDGHFIQDPWSNQVHYKYHIDSLELVDIYDMAKYLGRKHGEYLFDFFMNQWVLYNLPQVPGDLYYFHYNRKRNFLEPTDDDRFDILPDK